MRAGGQAGGGEEGRLGDCRLPGREEAEGVVFGEEASRAGGQGVGDLKGMDARADELEILDALLEAREDKLLGYGKFKELNPG